MIRALAEDDRPEILAIVNAAAEAYRGIIPPDRWKQPYMPEGELAAELAAGIAFSGWEDDGLQGVMGVQPVDDVILIRHAYVRPERQGAGIGTALLAALRRDVDRPILIGTWAAAGWAIRFYQARGFALVAEDEKAGLLKRYWTVPDRQIETSVVLGDARWFGGR
ncbi:MAG: GNAT family N-acetyltransferase [Defluviicoccus sp.]|nr:GNAT family N-acetyltransferase [Defluviicoccus sp.]